MRKISLFLAALSIGAAAAAQQSITSFSPDNGASGTTVTISGENFNVTAASNIVKFNGIAATVTNSTETSITTTVPVGATSGTISITIGANTVTSSSVFCVPYTAASTLGLLAYFPFSGNTNDLSGNSNNAINVGAALTTDRCGNPNSAILLNGSPSSYLKIPTTSTMESIITTQELTISTWVNIASLPSTVFPVFERYNPNNDNGMLYEINTSVGGELFNADYSTGTNVVCNRSWNLNQWYYVSVTYSKAVGLAKFYINGISVCSLPYSQSITTDVPRDFIIGQSLSGPDEYTNGALDEFRIYNRALSDCEIESLYSLTSITSFTPPSGPFGTQVNITGTNFDSTPTNNTVLFNGVSATITASSPTSIIATVPIGASTGPITVIAADCNPVTSINDFTVTYAVPFGNTVTMNGTTDYISITDNPALRPVSLTLESWINFSSAPSADIIIGKALNTTSNNNSYALYYFGGSLRGFVNNNATQNSEITYNWSPVIGQWYHVAFTFDNTSKTQSLYLNGMLVASGTTVSGPEYNNTPVTIGADFDFGSFDGWVGGQIDDARIWNVARTQAQIRSALNSTLVGNESGLIAYYKMDETGAGAGINTINSATATGAALNGVTVGTACTPIFTSVTPTISSFSPTFGPAGTTVVISGTNFSTIAANNVVQFNGITATVVSSTATSITTAVPAGSTSGTITVNTGCSSATSGTNFYNAAITFNTQPQASISVCEGATLTLQTAASGTTNINYQWQLLNTASGLYEDLTNDAVYSGVNTTALTINTTGIAGMGSYKNRASGDQAADLYSSVAVVNVSPCDNPPVIGSPDIEVAVGGVVTIDLTNLLSDADGNIDLSTLKIISSPASGAKATINPKPELIIDYTGIVFVGTESITIEVCDLKNACTEKILTIDVEGDIIVYNGVSPNGDYKNDVFYIKNIELLEGTKKNKVSIFNRRGDVVFSVDNYDNATNVFHGLSNSGSELPAGTYFYKIEFFSNFKTRTGYLSLKR